MMQAGLIEKAQDEFFLEVKREKEKRIALTRKSFNVISLKQLTFSFYVLGFGYACAIIIFVLELAIGGSIPVCQNRKTENKNTRKKNKSVTNSKLSILALKTDLRLKRSYERSFSVEKQCTFESCTSTKNENKKRYVLKQ